MKKREYYNIFANIYFWRTWDKKEIDIIEERDGSLLAYECKWSSQKNKIPNDCIEQYPDSLFEFINKDNFLTFVTRGQF